MCIRDRRGGDLECVVLNACCTGAPSPSGSAARLGSGRTSPRMGALGELLHQCGTPAVLCWGTRAHNDASAHFAGGVGESLARGDGYSAAFERGVGAVSHPQHAPM